MSRTQPSPSELSVKNLPIQRLNWNPNLTISKSLPIFVFVGILFVGIGSVIVYIFRNAEEIIIDYTFCKSANNSQKTCAEIIGNSTFKKCWCEVPFEIEKDIEAPVSLYYSLSNFHQNHRRYMMSRDNKQLQGVLTAELSPQCKPLDYVQQNNANVPIAPCGAIANSMFSDTLKIFSINYSMPVPLIRTGIVWPGIKYKKYRNPPGHLETAFKNFSKPSAWTRNVWELDTDPTNNGFENEDFIVWMQPAAFPTFQKLYRKVNHTSVFNVSLPRGNYQVSISYTYPVTGYGGTKSLIVANSTILGSKNMFLGIAYLVIGCICLIFAIILFILRSRYKKVA